MSKSKYDRIRERRKDIAAAEQRIHAEEAKIDAARSRIKVERNRIRAWKDEICSNEAALLAEKLRSSNVSLEDALAAIELQSDQQTGSGEESPS